MPKGYKEDPADAFMKTHLNDNIFNGEIVEIYTAFLKKIENLLALLSGSGWIENRINRAKETIQE